jgi:hypothetical protein
MQKLSRRNRTVYVMQMLPADQNTIPSKIWMPCVLEKSIGDLDGFIVKNVQLLGSDVQPKKYFQNGYLIVEFPTKLQSPRKHVFVLKITE